MIGGPHGELPAPIRQINKCVAVFPDVVTAAIGVGGTHGKGVAHCRNDAGTFDESFNMPLEGMTAHSRAKGVYAGASLTGANLSRDENSQRAFLGIDQYTFNVAVPAGRRKMVREFHAMLTWVAAGDSSAYGGLALPVILNAPKDILIPAPILDLICPLLLGFTLQINS